MQALNQAVEKQVAELKYKRQNDIVHITGYTRLCVNVYGVCKLRYKICRNKGADNGGYTVQEGHKYPQKKQGRLGFPNER